MTEQFRPCPFCGSRDAALGMDNVWCNECGAKTYEEGLYDKDESVKRWNTRATDAQINGLMQAIESQNQTAQAMVKRLEAQSAEIEELREALEALFVTQDGPPIDRMSDKVKWQDAMHKARAAIARDSVKEKTK